MNPEQPPTTVMSPPPQPPTGDENAIPAGTERPQTVPLSAPQSVISSDAAERIGKSGSGRLKLFIVLAAVVMIVGTVSVTIVLSRRSVSSWDILAAGNSASELSSDIGDIGTAANNIQTATTLDGVSTISNSLVQNISDAQRQYSILSTSPVLRNKQAAATFSGLRAKWRTYATFVQGTSNDFKVLGPLLIQLNTSQQTALAASRSASSNLSTELIQYQALVTSLGNEINTLNMSTTLDKQLAAELKSYVSGSKTGISQAQADLSAGKGLNAITGDITAIAAAATNLSNEQDTWASSTYKTLQGLDPTSNLSALNKVLSDLSKKTSS